MTEEGSQYDVEGIRERLIRYREADREIDLEIERLERLEARMTSARAQQLSGMPGSPNAPRDRMGLLVEQKEEMEQELYGQISNQQREWKDIEKILSRIRSSEEKEIIRLRYHDRESWSMVTDLIYSGRQDFEEKRDSYVRRVFRLHSTALKDMARAMKREQ